MPRLRRMEEDSGYFDVPEDFRGPVYDEPAPQEQPDQPDPGYFQAPESFDTQTTVDTRVKGSDPAPREPEPTPPPPPPPPAPTPSSTPTPPPSGGGSSTPPPPTTGGYTPVDGYTQRGITYAGFEPSSYTRNIGNRDPASAAKDWVYRYLIDNNIQPNNSWAPGAAAALNAQYGTNVFRAIDGETLGYGDEYVHSAPNGYGLRSGQYDPNATGEFFWGYTGGGTGGGGGGGGTTTSSGGGGITAPSAKSLTSGGSATGPGSSNNYLAQFGNMGSYLAGPGSAGVFPNDALQQVGQDPLSLALSGAIGKLLDSGGEPYSQFGQEYQATLKDMISHGGMNPALFESIRVPFEMAKKAQMDNLEAELADRGLIGSGENLNAIGRLEESIAPAWATALQKASTEAFGHGLDLAGQQVDSQQGNLLSAIQVGNQRQAMLADIALRELDQNRLWNQFLAEFGLKRDQVLAELQNGNLETILPLLSLFLQMTGISTKGFV